MTPSLENDMDAAEFRAARLRLGLSLNQLAHILGTEVRTIRKWEMVTGSNARPPNPIAVRIMTWLESGFRPPQWPSSTPSNDGAHDMSWTPCEVDDLIVGDAVRYSVKYNQRATTGEIALFMTAKGRQPRPRRVIITGRIIDSFNRTPEERTLIVERLKVEGGDARNTMLPDTVDRLPVKKLQEPKAELHHIPAATTERTDEAGRAFLLDRLRRAAGGDQTSKAAVLRVSECCLPESIERPDTIDQWAMHMGSDAAVRLLSGEEPYAEAVWLQLKGKLKPDHVVPYKVAPSLAPTEALELAPSPAPQPKALPIEAPKAEVIAGEVDPDVAAIMNLYPGSRVLNVRIQTPIRTKRTRPAE